MAKVSGDMSKLSVKPGQPLEESQLEGLGLTPMEKQAIAAGKLSPQFVNSRSEVAGKAAGLLKAQVDAYIAKNKNRKPVVAKTIDISQLPADQQTAAVGKVKNLLAESGAPMRIGSSAIEQLLPEVEPPAELPVEPVEAAGSAPLLSAATTKKLADANPEVHVVNDLAEKPSETVNPDNHVCVNCGWQQTNPPDELTNADKIEFLRCMLGGKPFTKTYELFGGTVKVTFRECVQNVNAIIEDQIRREMKDGRIPIEPAHISMLSYGVRMRKLQMTASLVSLSGRIDEPQPEVTSEEFQALYGPAADEANNALSVAHEVMFNGMSRIMYEAVYRYSIKFEGLTARLAAACASSDFWKETAALA